MPTPIAPTAVPAAAPAGTSPARRRVGRRAGALAGLLCATALLLTGCTQVHTALALQSDDTVNGDVVIATATGAPPPVVVPAAVADEVTVTPYQDSGYTGSRLRFTGLGFDQVSTLTEVVPPVAGRVRLQLRRTGGLVSLGGQADLSAVPVDRADVQLKVAFPGTVVNTDGAVDGDTVSWVFTPGKVNRFTAVLSSPDPSAPSLWRWVVLVGLAVAAAAAAVVVLARRHRNPPVYGSRRGR